MKHRIMATLLGAALSVCAAHAAARNWTATVAETPSGSHVLGNPAAEVKLVEYISYTCPHCAQFERQSDGAIKVGYVSSGKVSVEVRNFVRDPIDLTAAMLANCGPPAKFFLNHTALLRSQPRWIGRVEKAGPVQRQRWFSGALVPRARAIATDFGFYEIMASRGYDRKAADRCLADEPMARRLAEVTSAAEQEGVSGTPSFKLNDLLLSGTHDWRSLEPQINARL